MTVLLYYHASYVIVVQISINMIFSINQGQTIFKIILYPKNNLFIALKLK